MPVFLAADEPNARHCIHAFINDNKKNIAGGGEKSKMNFVPVCLKLFLWQQIAIDHFQV